MTAAVRPGDPTPSSMTGSPRNDLDHMRDAVFFDGPHARDRLSRFWILLVLASIIAAAGVVSDSTATVIGAMIVAPLMTPILGTMLAVVLGDRANLLRAVGLVVAGAAVAVLIGYVIGLVIGNDVVAANNSQVAGRITPGLIDLLAALATGIVGSVALVRRDISDTLPGVAIAISLVPPLSVVGLTAEAGEYRQSAGALLLFATNVAAILATGIIVMGLYGVHRLVATSPSAELRMVNRRNAVIAIVSFFLVIGAELTVSSISVARNNSRESRVRRAATIWSDEVGWKVLEVVTQDDEIEVRVAGPPPLPEIKSLAPLLEAEDIDPDTVVAELVPKVRVGSAR